MDMIRVCEPDISDIEKVFVMQALDENELSGHGRHVKEFEQKFAEVCKRKYCVMVPNGTIAIHLALAVLGIKPGDEVILPSQTISCCAFAVTALGATVVPVDVTRENWTMSANDLKNAIGPKTRAVIPTPVFAGVSPNIDDILEVCNNSRAEDEEHIHVIVDFAEAIGSTYNGRPIGSYGIMSTCSFFANKTIQTGEGGAVLTDSNFVYERLRFIRNNAYGNDIETRFLASAQGYNYRPHNLMAAIGLGQLSKMDYLIERRLKIHELYKQNLHESFVWQKYSRNQVPVPWMNTVLVPVGVNRRKFMEYMAENGIETRPTFPPIGSHPYLRDMGLVRERSEAISEIIWENGVIFPSGGRALTREVILKICELANEYAMEHDAL